MISKKSKKVRVIALFVEFAFVFGLLFSGTNIVKAAGQNVKIYMYNVDGTVPVKPEVEKELNVGDVFVADEIEGYVVECIIGSNGITFKGGTTPLGTDKNMVYSNETEITSMNAGCSIQVNYCKPIESIVIDGPSTVSIGTDVTYNKTITPTDADKQKLTWSVENGTGSASISSDAVLHPISAGTVTVKAVSKDARAVVGTFEVIIEDVVVPTPDPAPGVVSNPEPIQTKRPPKTDDIVGNLAGLIVLMFVACGVSMLCLKKDNKKI